MQYFGGKARIARDVVSVLNEYRKPNQLFVEPFCGGINITCLMGDNVIANDKNFELIEMYKALQSGWQPPENVTEEDYENAKTTFCRKNGLLPVPLIQHIATKCKLYQLGSTVQDLVEFSKGKSVLADIPREGIVVRCIENGKKLLSFKVINPDFLLKYNE